MGSEALERAYAISGSEDAKALYRDWAESYDEAFGAAYGYVAPREVARLYLARSEGDTPVLDVGAGTGLVAEHLPGVEIDGIDISPEMLAIAGSKGLYRDRIAGDLLEPLALPDAAYGAVVSCGTFTHGHVGPDCLPELLRVVRPGGLFVCAINLQVMDEAGFGSALARLVAAERISPVGFREIPLYAGATHEHADDRGIVMIFRRC